jgi:hypothetical protein
MQKQSDSANFQYATDQQVVFIIAELIERVASARPSVSTTVRELDVLAGPGGLRPLFSHWFNLKIPGKRWKSATIPKDSKTLLDISQMLSELGVVVPIFPPHFDKSRDDWNSDIFFALKNAMILRGAMDSDIHPSTLLGSLAGKFCLIPDVVKCAGPAAPPLQIIRTEKATYRKKAVVVTMTILIGITCAAFFASLSLDRQYSDWGVYSVIIFGAAAIVLAASIFREKVNTNVVGTETFEELSREIAQRLVRLPNDQLPLVAGIKR